MSSTEFLDEAMAELYGSDPAEFTERRAARAAQARAAGDRSAAKEIAGLRKPTRPAWMINQLVRSDPGVADQLARLGDELRAAEAALDGPKIRELSQARRRLVDLLIRQALQQAGERAPSAALREDLTATFGAALADPQVARELAAGTLLRPVHRADFSPGLPGLTLVPPLGDAAGAGGVTEAARARDKNRAAGKARAAHPLRPAEAAKEPEEARVAHPMKVAEKAKAAEEVRAARSARAAEAARAAEKAKAAEEARAAEEAKAAAERRRAIADAERRLEEASQAAEQAVQDERAERDNVQGLESQLDQARRRVSEARRRVRETQSAQQKARRALHRLDPYRG